MLVFALLATLIPSVTTGWISYLQNERSLSAKITGELQGVSAQTAREVDLWVKERLYELRVFASSYEVSENLDRIQRPGGERARERLTGYLRSVRVDAPQPACRRRAPHARPGGHDARIPRARGRGGGGNHEGRAAARLGGAGGGPRERGLPPGDAAPQRDRADRGGPACRRGSVRLLPRAPDHAAARPPHPGRGASGERRPRRALARGRRRRAEVRDRGVQRHGCPVAREPAWARAALRHRRSHRPV